MNADDTDATTRRKNRWRKTGRDVLGGTLIAGAAVVATIAITHKQAQRENLIAYLRGQVDGMKQGGWLDGWTAAEEWYAEHGVDELVEALAQERSSV